MIIQIFPSGPFSTNAYVVACQVTRDAAIIDPAPDSAKKLSLFLSNEKLNVKKILLTHSHWDHIADVKQLKDQFSIPVFIHPLDAPNLEQPGADGLPFWVNISNVKADNSLEDGMEIPIGKLKFKVLHTPGHSPGSVCFFEAHHHILISGDTLFKGSIGNLSFPTSQPSSMWPSLEKLAKLPLKTQIFPGHGPSTTLQAESAWLANAKNLFDK